MKPLRVVRWVIVIGVAAAVIAVLLGYASNVLTYRACERQVGYKVIRVVGRGRVGVNARGFPDSERILRSVGFQASRCSDFCLEPPTAAVEHAQSVAPFVVSVRWCASRSVGGGACLTTRFTTVFGRAIHLSDTVREIF